LTVLKKILTAGFFCGDGLEQLKPYLSLLRRLHASRKSRRRRPCSVPGTHVTGLIQQIPGKSDDDNSDQDP
jgi:hypothetical protein